MARGVLLGRRLQQLYAPHIATQPIPSTDDISDLFTTNKGIILDAYTTASLFQSADEATPVTAADQSVRRFNDLSPNALSGIVTNDGFRAVYKELAGGVKALRFDGSNDVYVIAGGLDIFKAKSFGTLIACFNPTSSAGAGQIFFNSINGNAGSTRFGLSKSGTNKLSAIVRRLDADTATTKATTASVGGARIVATVEADYAVGDEVSIQINNEAEETLNINGSAAVTSNTDSAACTVGSTGGATNPFLGDIERMFVIDAELDAQTKIDVKRWAGGGATAPLF